MSFLGKIADWFSSWVEHDDYFLVTVKKGDSLWRLAEELTGRGENWTRIRDANPEKAWTEDYVIQPGEVLRVPKD